MYSLSLQFTELDNYSTASVKINRPTYLKNQNNLKLNKANKKKINFFYFM